MSEYKIGDVVLADVPFSNSYESKVRPVIILTVENQIYCVCCCTSKDKSDKLPGKIVLENSLENKFFNFDLDTFISYSAIIKLSENEIVARIGDCDRTTMYEIIEFLDNLNKEDK